MHLLVPDSKDGKGVYIEPKVSDTVTGAPGVEQYFFTPQNKGTEMIRLEYKRPGVNNPTAKYTILISIE